MNATHNAHISRSSTASLSYRCNAGVPALTSIHCPFLSPSLHVHGSHGQNLAPLLAPQFLSHDAVDTRSNGITGLVEQDAGVIIELDLRTVAALHGVSCANNNGVSDVTASNFLGAGNAGHAGGGGGSVLLHNDDNAVTWFSC